MRAKIICCIPELLGSRRWLSQFKMLLLVQGQHPLIEVIVSRDLGHEDVGPA